MSEYSNSSFFGKRPSHSSEEASLPEEFRIIIKAQDETQYSFTYNTDMKMRRLFMAYCKQMNLEYGTVDFLYDGERLSSNKTLIENGLGNGDIIDAMLRQSGGGMKQSIYLTRT